MTAHLCAHPGVCRATKLGGTAKKVGGGTEKFFFGALRRNSCPPPLSICFRHLWYDVVVNKVHVRYLIS